MSIPILKQTVEAKTRRLSARWTFESSQDAQAMHGLDVEAEPCRSSTRDLVEIDPRNYWFLELLLDPGTVLTLTALAQTTNPYVGDRHALLAIEINRAANRIAARTRRGAGNYIVVSPEALTILQSASTSTFARTTEGSPVRSLTQNLLVSLTDLSKFLLTVMRLTVLKYLLVTKVQAKLMHLHSIAHTFH